MLLCVFIYLFFFINSSSSNNGGLSRSAEQLCERLAEVGDAPPKSRGISMTLSRRGQKSGGTWGSISRVFARQKKRAALDASLYDGKSRFITFSLCESLFK